MCKHTLTWKCLASTREQTRLNQSINREPGRRRTIGEEAGVPRKTESLTRRDGLGVMGLVRGQQQTAL